MSTWDRRVVGALACLALLTGGGRGLCFMQEAPSRAAATAKAHDCCKKGLSDKAPRCCHSQSRPDSAATVKKTTAISFPHAVPFALVPAVASLSVGLVAARPAVSHSPPPTVLRI